MSGIIRIQKSENYTHISNIPANDKELSWEARGVLYYLLTKPNGWECRNQDLINKGPAGEEKVERILDELQSVGYLTRKRVQGEDGKFDWETTIYEEPIEVDPATQERLRLKKERQTKKRAAKAAKRKNTIGGLSTDGLSTDGLSTDGLSRSGSSTSGEPPHIVNTESVNTESVNTESVKNKGRGKAKGKTPSPPIIESEKRGGKEVEGAVATFEKYHGPIGSLVATREVIAETVNAAGAFDQVLWADICRKIAVKKLLGRVDLIVADYEEAASAGLPHADLPEENTPDPNRWRDVLAYLDQFRPSENHTRDLANCPTAIEGNNYVIYLPSAEQCQRAEKRLTQAVAKAIWCVFDPEQHVALEDYPLQPVFRVASSNGVGRDHNAEAHGILDQFEAGEITRDEANAKLAAYGFRL